jgi:short-subunit dehydrogenase
MQLAGSTVLVTGASSGIGAATARRLARAGAVVGLVGRHGERLQRVLAECSACTEGAQAWQADLADDGTVAKLVRSAEAALGPLDALVNNAGIPMRRHASRLTMADVTGAMQVNYFAAVRLTLSVLPSMLARGRGTIVNVGSSGGRIGTPGQAAYAATKFALTGFTEVLAIDLWGTGVVVRLVQPGPIDTPLWAAPGNDPPMHTGPRWPAGAVAQAIEAAITGAGPVESFVPPDIAGIVARHAADPENSLRERVEWARAASGPGGGAGAAFPGQPGDAGDR